MSKRIRPKVGSLLTHSTSWSTRLNQGSAYGQWIHRFQCSHGFLVSCPLGHRMHTSWHPHRCGHALPTKNALMLFTSPVFSLPSTKILTPSCARMDIISARYWSNRFLEPILSKRSSSSLVGSPMPKPFCKISLIKKSCVTDACALILLANATVDWVALISTSGYLIFYC